MTQRESGAGQAGGRHRRRFLKQGAALAAAASLGVHPLYAHAADGEVSIGFVGPVTGPFAELGTAMRDGALIAVEAVNAQGGVRIGGRSYTIKLVVGDEENVPERAVAATRRLIEVDKVMGILGYAISTNLLAAMQLLQDSKIPMIDTSGRADSIPRQIAEKKMDYLFQLSPTNRDFVDLHGQLIKHYGKPKRVAILAFNTDFAREYANQAESVWPKLIPGVEVKSFYVEANKMDLQPELLQIRRFDPQVLWVLLTGTQSYQFVDQFAASGMVKRMLPLGDSIYGSELFRRKNGEKVDYHMANAITDRKPFTDLTLPFYDAFKAKTGNNPPYYAVQTYDGMLMMIEGLRRMKAVTGNVAADRTALRDALVSISDARPVKGARGTLAFAPLEKGRTVTVNPVIVQYQPGGGTTVIWPLDQAGVFMDPRN
jgi:branched-chain amino acid transport system substrate-binding protein